MVAAAHQHQISPSSQGATPHDEPPMVLDNPLILSLSKDEPDGVGTKHSRCASDYSVPALRQAQGEACAQQGEGCVQ